MAKPASLDLGNTLTLVEARNGVKYHGEDYKWADNLNHPLIGKPRVITGVRSEYVEIGPEKSVLKYPKVGEYSEDPSICERPGRIVLKYVFQDPVNNRETSNILIYEVKRPEVGK